MPKWLETAVFYEIYPQSFCDSNKDGIGDIEGIISKLDYIQDLGCKGIWLNPCFDSPFKDAGYDVRDYKKVAPRYGTNEDLCRLFAQAHKRAMRVILDLVPGHTSEEHDWFLQSKEPEPNEYSDRYIWTRSWLELPGNIRYIVGEADRDGVYLLNFFKCQPALNYGFLNPTQPWQLPTTHPSCVATKEALFDIMRFWLEKGADGFRVDMADSLVKDDDPNKSGTSAIWQEARAWLDRDYPEAFLVSEWSCPNLSLKAGFHADFLLDHPNSGYKSLVRNYDIDWEKRSVVNDTSFFKRNGNHDPKKFLDQYLGWYKATKDCGYISLITGNHDTPRLGLNLEHRELALAYAVFLTLPGVPFIYYGDEIGMLYQDLVSKEGGYTRTGSRTPMQWAESSVNAGFSDAPADKLYLPVDTFHKDLTVEYQEKHPDSLLNTVKRLIRLRTSTAELGATPNLEVLNIPGLPLAYKRGPILVAVNPGNALDSAFETHNLGTQIFSLGSTSAKDGVLHMGEQSFGVWRL